MINSPHPNLGSKRLYGSKPNISSHCIHHRWKVPAGPAETSVQTSPSFKEPLHGSLCPCYIDMRDTSLNRKTGSLCLSRTPKRFHPHDNTPQRTSPWGKRSKYQSLRI